MFFVLSRAWSKEKNSESPQGDSGRGIRRSEVRFLMGNQNFFDLLSVTMLTCPIFYRDKTSALSFRITCQCLQSKHIWSLPWHRLGCCLGSWNEKLQKMLNAGYYLGSYVQYISERAYKSYLMYIILPNSSLSILFSVQRGRAKRA